LKAIATTFISSNELVMVDSGILKPKRLATTSCFGLSSAKIILVGEQTKKNQVANKDS
jgi:hypothetical protein